MWRYETADEKMNKCCKLAKKTCLRKFIPWELCKRFILYHPSKW